MCIEDAACMAALLGGNSVRTAKDLDAVLEVYNNARIERGHWLVQSSRYLGNMYDWMSKEGSDMTQIEAELRKRNAVIYEADVAKMMDDAVADLEAKLA